MKATRKLIPAIALLLVSAVLLSTASYAWFTTNKVVNADMTVSVTAPQNLQIKGTKSGAAWSNALDIGDFEELTPCSSKDGVNFVTALGLQLAKDGIFADTAALAAYTGNLSIVEEEDKEDYYVSEGFSLRTSQPVDAGNLSLVATVTTADPNYTNAYLAAVKVMVFMEQEGSYVPVYANAGSHKAIIATTSEGTTTYTVDTTAYSAIDKVKGDGSDDNKGIAFEAATVYNFKVVVWVEGNDPACISEYVDKAPELKVNLKFEVKTTATP